MPRRTGRPIDELAKFCRLAADHAWYGGRTMYEFRLCGNVIRIEGYTYEPGWELFSATASLKVGKDFLFRIDSRNVESYHNETVSYGKFDTLGKAIEYLKERFPNGELLPVSAALRRELG